MQLQENMPLIESIPNGRYFGRFIGLFGRKIECYPRRRRRSCFQYIYVWNGQLAPMHPMDYEPVFVFIDDFSKNKDVLYDFDHYHIGRGTFPKNEPIRFTINGWWHSFRLKQDSNFTGHPLEPRSLVDDYIWHWWDFEDSKAKLTLKEGLLNPWTLMGWDHFSGVTSIIAETLYLLCLLWARSVSSTSKLKGALGRLIHGIVTVKRLEEESKLKNQRLSIRLQMGSLILLDSLSKYNLIKLGWTPSFLENMPNIHTKKGGQTDEIRNLMEIISEMSIEEFQESVYSAEENVNSSRYMNDLHRTLEGDNDLVEESRQFLDEFDL